MGTPVSQADVYPLMWQLGSCFLFEEVLSPASIFFMFVLGRRYRGTFQDMDMLQFITHEACSAANLAILESLDTEQQPPNSATTQKGDGFVRGGGMGMAALDGGSGVVWDLEKLAPFLLQLSGRRLIFAFNGSYAKAMVPSATLSIVNLIDIMSAAASPLGGMP